MPKIPPIVRISFGLVMLTGSILLLADLLFGLSPDYTQPVLDARKKLVETLAVQYSGLAATGNAETIAVTVDAVVARNADVLSAAVRREDGTVLVRTDGHDDYWGEGVKDGSTPTHARVPIFSGDVPWGAVEVRFADLTSHDLTSFLNSPFVRVFAFVTVAAFLAFWMFMSRTLRQLDPSSVIPDRVKAALDVLTEGVVVLDTDERIVLANTRFLEVVDETLPTLLGRQLSELAWTDSHSGAPPAHFPWSDPRLPSSPKQDVQLCLTSNNHGVRTFTINTSAIADDDGKARGSLVSFDDITDLERKNVRLEQMLDQLQVSQEEVERQNERLTILATRDPLTNCFNRRIFFEKFEEDFAQAAESGEPLSCIMGDIDKFKLVNDTFGHVVGDQVIRQIAALFQTGVRTIDYVGRYGGEEFCIVLPNCERDDAIAIAEGLRRSVETLPKEVLGLPPSAKQVTSSFGVSFQSDGAETALEMVEQADRALYVAKTSGRNQVKSWHDVSEEQAA